MIVNAASKKKFKEDIVPLFDKVIFTSEKPFIIPLFKTKEEYNSYFYFIYHAAIYKTITFIQGYEIDFEDYTDIFKRYIHNETIHGSTTIYYQRKAILKISPHTNKDNSKTEAIYPLYKKLIESDKDLFTFDKDILSKIKKEKEKENSDYNNAVEQNKKNRQAKKDRKAKKDNDDDQNVGFEDF